MFFEPVFGLGWFQQAAEAQRESMFTRARPSARLLVALVVLTVSTVFLHHVEQIASHKRDERAWMQAMEPDGRRWCRMSEAGAGTLPQALFVSLFFDHKMSRTYGLDKFGIVISL